MKQIQADFKRQITLPGVPAPVKRPVDIDRSATDFTHLRSLRIYCFDAGTAIDGHAEEDEVFLVILSGTLHLKLGVNEEAARSARPLFFGAPDDTALQPRPCAAYLPPEGAYCLQAIEDAVVAYARATPTCGSAPRVFTPLPVQKGNPTSLIAMEATYAQRLRFRLYWLRTEAQAATLKPIATDETEYEALLSLHASAELTMTSLSSETLVLRSFDSVAIGPGEQPDILVPAHTAGLLLLVLASSGV